MTTLSFSDFFNLPSNNSRYEYAVKLLHERFFAKVCLIGKFVDNDTRVKTVVHSVNGLLVDNIVYDLSGTPCKDAKSSNSICLIDQCVQQKYQSDEALRVLNVDGYLGVTLRALDHRPIGIMVCLFEQCPQLTDDDFDWFKELSYLIGAELNHHLEIGHQEALLNHLTKGERIAQLCSWSWNLKSDMHWFSVEMPRLMQQPQTAPTLSTLIENLTPCDKQKITRLMDDLKQGKVKKIDVTVEHKSRTLQRGLFHIVGEVESLEGNERCFNATIQDVSYISSLNEQLELTNVVFENASEAIMICNAQNQIIMVNKTFEQTTGYSAIELIGKDPKVLSSGLQDHAFYSQMWRSLDDTGRWKGEIFNRRKNGQIYPEELTLTVVRNEAGEISNFVAIFRDITEWKRNEAQLMFYANHEPLTGLLNRRSFMDKLESKISECRSLYTPSSLIFLGLDRFKEVNDVFGPEIGDKILNSVAKRLRNSVREQDLVCRYGGDEFVILINKSSEEEAYSVACKLSAKLRQPYVFGELTVELSASIGVAQLEEKVVISAANLIRNAAHALTSAKKSNPGSVAVHNHQIQSAYLQKIYLKQKLKQAVKDKQLKVYYQPIVDIACGKIIKLEALVRWFDDEHCAIGPNVFIPLAEEFGFIHLVGQFVLEQSCKDLLMFKSHGFDDISISVNRSVNEFKVSNNQLELVLKALNEANIEAKYLTLEVTESIATNSYTWDVLEELRKAGVTIALDDFCTGFSSLSNLIEHQVDFLKIDKTFVDSLIADKSKQVMISGLIQIASKLGIKVIAEGVETQAQLDLLADFGCHYVQGYYFSPAKPASACLDMLKGQILTAE
ncbi:diguanylate cyclase/phosphodiesterase (GGDEF & EAL domains) with PAS/PAC sensor(s) [Pseudoalteromonas luteoviolacea B = ATCC 29581]|nr:diguanylate cyclase/phosphodiesterase (GGDEF & EAL domains) with PAS/PAC sensor(s) [Pseudoalteromonas luteoviolacea B = ATCC 29581]